MSRSHLGLVACIIKNMTISTISSKLLFHLQPNLVLWYSIISQRIVWKILITVFKVKVTVMVQNVSECLSRWRLLKYRRFVTKLGMVMQQLSRGKILSAIFKVKVIAKAHMIKYCSFCYIFWIADSSASRLGLVITIISLSVFCKSWITAFKVKVTAKHQNVSVNPGDIF